MSGVHLCRSLAVSLPLQVVCCFGLKDVHHSALPGYQVVLVSWQGWISVECLRHTGTLGGTPEREREAEGKCKYVQRCQDICMGHGSVGHVRFE